MKLKTHLLLGTVLVGTLAGVAPASWASSHREAPATAGMPRVDATDFYMFRSYETDRGAYVTLIANYLPLQAPYGGPNYFKLDNDAIYEIHIDNDGDAREDLTFQFNFDSALVEGGNGKTYDVDGVSVAGPLRQAGAITALGDANINETESYTLRVISGDRRRGTPKSNVTLAGTTTTQFVKPIDNIGEKTLPAYAAYADDHIYPITIPIPGCTTPGKVFVGQRAEAFAVNLGEIFDLVNLVPVQGALNPAYPDYSAGPGGIVQDRTNDDLIGESNVTSIALELPISCLTGEGNGVIGGWTTASLPQAQLRDPSPTYNGTTRQGGAMVQVSRLSAPLVNEVVIGLKDKDLFNAARPTIDSALATYVTNPVLPELLQALFPSVSAPNNFPRRDLLAAFLTGFAGVNQQEIVTGSEMMRLNTGLPVTPRDEQHTFGLVAEDVAGFPNGRRPGDDVVDIALRVLMGALCHDLPLGSELTGDDTIQGTPADLVNLDLCGAAPGATPEENRAAAPSGTIPFTDGAPLSAKELLDVFPYLNPPIPGSTNSEG